MKTRVKVDMWLQLMHQTQMLSSDDGTWISFQNINLALLLLVYIVHYKCT